MNIVDPSRFRPFGGGHLAPIGSIKDTALAGRIAAYKRNVAGQYHSIPPDDIQTRVPNGSHIVSPKIDGEQWFLYSDGGATALLAPNGRAITGIPLTEEAGSSLGARRVLIAGELFANGKPGRPRMHDLAAALGGGAMADVDRLKFAPFDLLQDGNEDAGRLPFTARVERMNRLLGGSTRLRPVDFKQADSAEAIATLYDEWVTKGGAEGVVVRCADGRILKIKPEITIDAVVVGFSESGNPVGAGRIGRLLLALMVPDGGFRLIGSVGTGFTDKERGALHSALTSDICAAAYRKATAEGALYRCIRPRLVVEVKCNDIITHHSDGASIRRISLNYSHESGWTPVRNVPAVSMINAVFVRMRDDKSVDPAAARFSQVTDIAPVETADADAGPLPKPNILRREVYVKASGQRTLVRKLVVWKTNREDIDPAWPPFAAYFTDFSPGRGEPLKTDLRVAASLEIIMIHVDDWLGANIKRGWERVALPEPDAAAEATDSPSIPAAIQEPPENESISAQARTPDYEAAQNPETVPMEKDSDGAPVPIKSESLCVKPGMSICISFPRSGSANFAIAMKRAKALATASRLEIEADDKGRQTRFNLTLDSDIVENAVKIQNLVRIVSRWRSSELSIGGEPVSLFEFDSLLEEISNLRQCFRRHKGKIEESGSHICGTDSPLGCRRLRIESSQAFLKFLRPGDMPWFGVGTFDGKVVKIDKAALRAQADGPRNERLALCPLFDVGAVYKRIARLPDSLDPAADSHWVTVCSRETGKPVWVLPRELASLPFDLIWAPREKPRPAPDASARLDPDGLPAGLLAEKEKPPARRIPNVHYSDVKGQDAAVESVRDCVELPLRHADLFERVGVRGGGGVLLYGPPGNGKTLLAKAVAGETSAHIEIVSGPEILSKWVGESERALRDTFERAGRLAPSVILFDEIDAIAPARDAADAHHQKILVSQILVLMDGLEARGRVFVIATTNRPDDIDSALKRPGRLDRMVYVGPPDINGREAIFGKYISRMRVGAGVSPVELAAATPRFSGAMIEYVCREAGLLCIKEALRNDTPPDSIEVLPRHFHQAVRSVSHGAGLPSPADSTAVLACRN